MNSRARHDTTIKIMDRLFHVITIALLSITGIAALGGAIFYSAYWHYCTFFICALVVLVEYVELAKSKEELR